MPKIMDHIVLNVRNIDAMLLFYVDVLGLSSERVQEFRAGQTPFPSVRINADTIVDLFPIDMKSREKKDQSHINSLNHFCLSMDKKEWEELQKRLTSHNIPIEEGPIERWGAHGSGISIYILDPENNKIELRYYP
ncbi:putative glyoxalase/bleomycin resistance protein/dioxygenase [Legionella sainthelensi]|uniref:VOC family protein n=1 Tax=Legionella sainthelensi TaxID=28087 RepID=UPI000F6D2F10|nr:VOC family protein [Legionella sainthelensi]VEB34091.1 putative glyoxalase/bleomycin resistance protein/dioxygenase [Legionella sainthelensi]